MVETDAPIAHPLASALDRGLRKNSDRMERIQLPRSGKDINPGARSKIKNCASIIDRQETDAYRGSTSVLELDGKAVKRLAAVLKAGSQWLLDLGQKVM